MKRIVAMVLCLAMVFALCACGHEHTWEEATCTSPRTCTECGKTEGEALGHIWKDATCTEPKTCTVCGETEGSALGHDAGPWKTVREPSLVSGGKEEKVCKVCGEVVDTRTTDKKAIKYSGGTFNFTEDELIEYLKDSYNSKYSFFATGSTTDPFKGTPYGIAKDGNLEAIISLLKGSGNRISSFVVWGKGTQDTINNAIFIYTLVCQIDASSRSEEIFDSLKAKDSCTINGIKITFKNEGSSGGDTYISFTVTGA